MGFNSRLDNLQAAILNVKLKYLQAGNDVRRTIANKYGEAYTGLSGLTLPTAHPSAKHVYHQYVVMTENRDKFIAHLKEKGVDTGVHYPKALHQLPALSEFSGQSFPNAEKLAAHCVSLPMCPTLTDEQVTTVTRSVRSYFGK